MNMTEGWHATQIQCGYAICAYPHLIDCCQIGKQVHVGELYHGCRHHREYAISSCSLQGEIFLIAALRFRNLACLLSRV